MDSKTGEPYKNSSVSSIERSLITCSVIDQFRDAVLSKNPNKLARVDASNLLVYKNKASFNKRNNVAKDEGKEEALDPTESVDGTGFLVLDGSRFCVSRTKNGRKNVSANGNGKGGGEVGVGKW